MNSILVPVFGLALLDSVNPSAIAVTLYLLTQPRPFSKVTVYMAAVFLVYWMLGILLMAGLGLVIQQVGAQLEHPAAYAIQGLLGALMLIYSFVADPKPKKEQQPKTQHLGAIALLGVTITLVEFSTALPYLGAIGLLTQAKLTLAEWLPILLIYNLIFILPPLILLLLYGLFVERMQARFVDLHAWLQRGSRETFLWITGIAGFLMLTDAARYFLMKFDN